MRPLRRVADAVNGLLAERTGLRVSRLRPELSEEARTWELVRRARASLVLDVGANTGQFAQGLLAEGYDGRIVSFEPLPDAHRALVAHAAGHPRWTIAERGALGRAAGTLPIYRSGNVASSSLLPMREEHVAAAPGTETVGKEDVEVRRLDDVPEVAEATDAVIFLKIDVQGYELEVLAGAERALPRVAALLLECSIVPCYEGSPLIADVIGWLTAHGYQTLDLVSGFQAPDGQMMQVNLLAGRPELAWRPELARPLQPAAR
jgi:FkbM family methyltransferase